MLVNRYQVLVEYYKGRINRVDGIRYLWKEVMIHAVSYKLFSLGHRNLIKIIAQNLVTGLLLVINIVFQLILTQNRTFRMLVNIHFQKWRLQIFQWKMLEVWNMQAL